MKKILGLDIGTNSIGGALINLPEAFEDYGKEGSIEWLGSRIIPTDGDYLQKFESGSAVETKAAYVDSVVVAREAAIKLQEEKDAEEKIKEEKTKELQRQIEQLKKSK